MALLKKPHASKEAVLRATVRSNLDYWARWGKIIKDGKRENTCWRLLAPPSDSL